MEKTLFWTCGSGRINLVMTTRQAHSGYHQGPCDEDVQALSQDAGICAQLDTIDPDTLRAELREYGTWDADELADHEQNLQRILWLACGDLCDTHEED